jgi:hypothetical protein
MLFTPYDHLGANTGALFFSKAPACSRMARNRQITAQITLESARRSILQLKVQEEISGL